MSRRVQTLIVAAVLAVGLFLAGLALPVPFVTLVPGPVTNTLGSVDGQPLIKIDGRRTYPTTGKLELTTVEEHPQLNLGTAISDWFRSDSAVVPRELLQPPGTSDAQLQQQNTQEMIDSQDQATTAALAQLKINPTGVAVLVDQVPAGSPSAGKLNPGDRVLSVDGTAVTGQAQLRTLIGRVKPGKAVTIGFTRGAGASRTVTITTRAGSDDPNQAIIGVTTAQKSIYPFTVTIGLKDVGGPSAGLMFALGIIDKLTPGDLAGGKIIAGTGTIDQNGVVGPIGGIQQKLLGARRSGAVAFLVPVANCAEAQQTAPSGLRLIKVDTLASATASLQTLATSSGSGLPSC